MIGPSISALASMEKPMLIIPDASIVLAYILRETEHEAQLALFFERAQIGTCDLLCPALLHHEITNRLSRIEHFPEEKVLMSLQAYTALELTPDLVRVALGLVRKYGAVWYDAVYHSTALVYGGMLLTADKKYYNLTKSEGNSMFIGDYS